MSGGSALQIVESLGRATGVVLGTWDLGVKGDEGPLRLQILQNDLWESGTCLWRARQGVTCRVTSRPGLSWGPFVSMPPVYRQALPGPGGAAIWVSPKAWGGPLWLQKYSWKIVTHGPRKPELSRGSFALQHRDTVTAE